MGVSGLSMIRRGGVARPISASPPRSIPCVHRPMLHLLIPSALAALAGISIVVQQALNASLRGALSSTAWSGVVSYLVGLACMTALAVALRDPVPSASVAARIPW